MSNCQCQQGSIFVCTMSISQNSIEKSVFISTISVSQQAKSQFLSVICLFADDHQQLLLYVSAMSFGL